MLHRSLPNLLAALAVILFACFLAFKNLNAHSISQRSDEIIYARVIQSITRDHKILFPTHGDIPFFNKPPFKLWVDAVAIELLGESNGSFRFVSAASGVALAVLTIVAGAAILGSPWAGVLGAFFLLAFPELTLSPHGMRRCVLDPFLSVLCSVAILLGYRALTGDGARRKWVWFGLLVAAGILTKSVAGILPWAVIVPFALAGGETRRAAWIQRKRIAAAVLISAALPAIYYGLLLTNFPKAFQTVVGWEIMHRAVSGYSGHDTGQPFFYFEYLEHGKLGPPALLGLGFLLAAIGFRDSKKRLLLCWAAIPVVLYSLAESKVPWYLMPAFPAFGLLSGFAITISSGWIARNATRGLQAAALAIFTALVAAVAYPVVGTLTRTVGAVMTQTERIPLDRLSEEIEAAPAASVYLVGKPFTRRANPVHGKFNLEGIYLARFWNRAVKVETLGQVPAASNDPQYIFLKADDPGAASVPITQGLPSLPPRDDAVVLVKR